MDKKIEIMQHNLVHIRKYFGLSAKDLGEMVGVTRQTINNIEAGKGNLTKTMYLAILYVMEKYMLPNLNDDERAIVLKMLDKKVLKNTIVFEE